MKKTFLIVLFVSILLSSCGKVQTEETKYFKTHVVGEGFIASKDSLLAMVEGKNVSDLSFKNPGRIRDIFVKKGDIVMAGQILATLTNEEATIGYAGSKDILKEMTNLGSEISQMGQEKITLLEKEYDKSLIGISLAQKDFDLAQSNFILDSRILADTSLSGDQRAQQAEKALAMAKNNLENSKKMLDSNKINTQKNAVNSLSNAYIIARNAREYVDVLLGVTDANRNKNDAFEYLLGARNSSTKTVAESSFRKFNAEYEKTYTLYNDSIVGKTDISKDTLLTVLKSALSTLESLRINLHDTKELLSYSVPSVGLLEESTISAAQSQLDAFVGNLEQSILTASGGGVQGSIEAIESFDDNYTLRIKQLEDTVALSEEDLNLAKTGKEINSANVSKNIEGLKTNVSVKEDTLRIARIGSEQAKINIELAKQESRAKLAEINSRKAEVQMNVDLAENGIESGIIRAPFDGVILSKYLDIGGVVGAGMPVLKISSNEGKYIKVYIDNDTYGLKVGDMVKLENEKDGKILFGTLENIDSMPDIMTRKNYAEVKIEDAEIQIGERLLALIGRESGERKMIIPLSAVITKYGEPGVYILENGSAKFQMIKTGEADDTFVAIEGLKIGDRLITEGKDNILDGEKLEGYEKSE